MKGGAALRPDSPKHERTNRATTDNQETEHYSLLGAKGHTRCRAQLFNSAIDHPIVDYCTGWITRGLGRVLETSHTSRGLVRFTAYPVDLHGHDRDQYHHGYTNGVHPGEI